MLKTAGTGRLSNDWDDAVAAGIGRYESTDLRGTPGTQVHRKLPAGFCRRILNLLQYGAGLHSHAARFLVACFYSIHALHGDHYI